MKQLEKIYKLELAPAMGKSYANITNMCSRVIENKERFILAAITLELCRQTEDDILQRYPEVRLCRVTSDTKNNGLAIGSRIHLAMASGNWDIVIITHEALKSNFQTINAQGWNLVIDEVFTPIRVSSFVCKLDDDPVVNFTEKVKDGRLDNESILKLKHGAKVKLEDKILFTTSNESHYDKRAISLWESLLEGNYIQCKYDTTADLYRYSFLTTVNPHKVLGSFDSVLVLSANATTTLFGVIYSKVYKIPLLDCDYIDVLRSNYPNPARINISYLLQDLNISKWLMDKNCQVNDGDNIFTTLWNKAISVLPQEPFIYAVNKDKVGEVPIIQDNRGKIVSISSHGLNHYSSFKNVITIFACNPRPYDIELFHSYEDCNNLVEGSVVDAYITTTYYESVFQVVTRCAIRDFSTQHTVNLVVPDKRCADYLTDGWFAGATVHKDCCIKYTPPPIGRPSSFNKMYQLTNSENGKFYRWKKKQGLDKLETTNIHHCQLVEDFINTIRTTNNKG